MTDNYNFFRDYFRELGIPERKEHINDLVFEIQLLRRGKDCPDMPAANYSFKNYYVDSIESYDRYEDEIKKCCEMFRLRAYISVNVKSKTKLQLQCLKILSDNLYMGELKKPWKIFYKAFGNTKMNDQRWIVDIDNVRVLGDIKDHDFVDNVKKVIEQCESGYEKNIICEVQTKSGIHIITHPFNISTYEEIMRYICGPVTPEIKKNHITLLYENL